MMFKGMQMNKTAKNKLYFSIALFVVLVLTSGSFAYTWTTSETTIGIVEPTGNIATSNATATQPDWDSILTPVTETENLSTNGPGDETLLSGQFPASGEHWDKVDDDTSDSDSTYVYTDSASYQEDLYEIEERTTGAGTINYVKFYIMCRSNTANITQASAYIHIKTNGNEHNTTPVTVTTDYAAYSYQWNTNPQSTDNWTWDEISDLQIGAGLRSPNDVDAEETRCTRVYAEVSYDAPPLEGEVPSGNIFTIVPDVDYSGDLLAKFYLTNTANLTKAYSYLNMKIYMAGSVEAGQTPDYRLLTMQNGEVSINFDDLVPLSESWIQTSQGDFQGGTLNQVVATALGDVILDDYADSVNDTYNDETKIASSANVTVSGGQVKLSGGAGSGSETLRPNAAGDETNITTQYPASGAHYDKVDEATSDDWSTYVSTNSSSATNWYNTDWKYRNKITINSANVTGDLVNFPVLINTADATWRYTTSGGNVGQSDGGDILFTTSSGTSKLDHEIEKYTPTTGELIAWIEVPDLSSSTDTDIYMYYGNASVADQWNVTGTWDDNYVMVQHLDDDPDTSTTQDSTSNNHDGTKGSANNPIEAPGQIGDAQDFSYDQISCGDLAIGDNYTAECWIKADTLTGNGDYDTYGFTIMASALSGQGYPLWLTVRGTEVRLWAYETTPGTGGWRETTGAGLNTTDRFHIVATANKSSTTMVYVNGVQRLSFTNDGEVNWTNIFTIGDLRPNRAIYFDGVIDEVRISNTIRNTDWIETSYNNQDNPGVFYSVGSAETNGYQRDLYNMPSHSTGSGTIDDVTAYFRFAMDSDVGDVGIWQDTNNTHTIGATGAWTNVPFNSEARSDGSYNHTADTTTDLTADGWYLIIYEIRSTSTSDTRHSIISQITLEGTAVEGSEGYGYSRNNSNDEAYTGGACIVNASANDTVVVQWQPYGLASSDVLSNSKTSLCIVRLPDSANVAYLKYTDDSDTGAYGGTTWAGNEVTWADQVYETDNTTIQKSTGNDYTFTLKKVARYLVKYDITFTGGDAVRTQRIARATLAGSAVPNSYTYTYMRNNVTTPNTLHAVFIVDNTIANQDLIIQSQRGAADVDASVTRTISSSSIEIMELPSSAETVITYDSVGGQDVGATQTLNWARDEEQRDSAAFTLPAITTVEVEKDGDYLFLGNGLIEDPDKTTSTRLTFAGDWFVGGVENNIGGHGNFLRGAQGGQDTWQTSLNAHTILELSADEQITFRTALEGDAGGTSDNTLADQCGLTALRIDSLTGSAYARAVVKSGAAIGNGTEESTDSGTFTLESYQWTTNPATGQPWTWSEIDSLQLGIELKSDSTDTVSACTQVYIEVNYTTYYTNGTVNSVNLLSGETVYTIDDFDYNVSAIPSGTGLQVQFSQDDTNWYNSSGTPGGWDTMSAGSHSIDLSGLSWSGSNFYYHMLFTSDGGGTPVLDDITGDFTTLYTSGDLISSAFDTGDDLDWNWLTVYFTIVEPSATDIKFQLRSASTQAGLSSATWYGPTSTSDYYTGTTTTINPVHDGDRWIQYRAYFTGPGDDTPTLSDIEVTYTSTELSYTVEIIGGAYCLNTRDSSEWDDGWTVTPEIYCEVVQR